MWEVEQELIFKFARGAVDLGLIIGSQGNISLRFYDEDGGQFVAITPSGIDYYLMTPRDVAILNAGGKRIAGNLEPSIETDLHLNLYSTRDDINAVVHTHSEFASVVSVMGSKIPPILDDQVIYLGGEVSVAKHAIPGTKGLAANVVSALGNANAVILSNHGALAVGKDMNKALFNARLIEKVAKVFVYASLSDKLQKLPVSVVEKELLLFKSGGKETTRKKSRR
jgi:L-fuculose-phosphate aldolase